MRSMKPAGRFLCGCIFLLLTCLAFAESEELAAKSQRAKDLMAAGRFEEAVLIYSELVRALPNNPGLIMNLGMALHMAGQDRKAIREFDAVLKLDPGNIPARLFLGAAHLKLGEPARAVEPLERVLRAQSDKRADNLEAREMLAQALSLLGRFERAADQYEALAALAPKNPKTWYGLGASYESLAQRAFGELEKVAPESAHWLALVAESRLKQQQYSSAFYLYRQALAKSPEMRGIHAALAEIYKDTGHRDWAAIEEGRERALSPPDCTRNSKIESQKSPNPSRVSNLEFRVSANESLECDFLAGRYREVVASAKRAKTAESLYWRSRASNGLALQAFSRLAQLPPSAEMHELMAGVYGNHRQYKESANEWQAALKLSPGDPRIQRELAIALKLSGDNQGAQALLEGLVRGEPNSAELNYLLGDTLLNLQQADAAVPLLKKAVEREPKLLAAHSSLARAYIQIGQDRQAIPHLKAALPADKDGSLHYQLARAYQTSGQQQLADKLLRDYQEIRKSAAAERQALEQEVQITPPEH